MNDMTQGSPIKQLILFMMPVLLGNLFQTFYNIVDVIIVGRYLGVDALAAVGMTGSIVFLVVGWIMGLTSGFGILIAQAFGANDKTRLQHYCAMSTYICIGFAVVMTTGLLLANDWILSVMNTPENIFADTKAYIGLIYVAIPATFLYNMLASASRAIGDSKTPLYFLVFSSVLNIALDVLFVGVLPFGVAGAGYATAIAQAVSGILCLIYVYRQYPELRFAGEEAKYNWETFRKLMNMGIPMGLQFSITAIGTMIVQSSLNLLGSMYIAAYASSCKIQNVIMQVYAAMGSAIANFAGQNYGAGKLERVKKGVNSAIAIIAIYGFATMLLAYYVCPNAVVIFAEDTTGELVTISREYFHIVCWFYIPLGLIFVYRNGLQGIGNGVVPMLGGVFELLARALVIGLLFERLQFAGIGVSDVVAWVFALIPLLPFYYWKMWNLTRGQNLKMQH